MDVCIHYVSPFKQIVMVTPTIKDIPREKQTHQKQNNYSSHNLSCHLLLRPFFSLSVNVFCPEFAEDCPNYVILFLWMLGCLCILKQHSSI